MDPIEKLAQYFKDFPGVGPRQAKRFVYFLLRKNDSYVNEMAKLIPELKKHISICEMCFRYFPFTDSSKICPTCGDVNRNAEELMIVARDTDFESVQKSGSYKGYYFILGGQLPVLEDDHQKYIHLAELRKILPIRFEGGLQEIIIALNANSEGDYTADFLRDEIQKILGDKKVKISILGRGLSTGSELEYADKETISQALLNRK